MCNESQLNYCRGQGDDGLVVNALDSRSSGLAGASAGRGHRVVFLHKTPNSQNASLHSGV